MAAKPTRHPQSGAISFTDACALVESALHARADIVADAMQGTTVGQSLLRLRDGLRANVLRAGPRLVHLDRVVKEYDARTRREGFHALNDWDGKADQVNEDSIPVDVLHFIVDQRGDGVADPVIPAILLDYYLVHLLSLLSLRLWDDGDADENLVRLNGLLRALQGPQGSGQMFVDDAETLILIATSHYEREERGYDVLLERVRTLNAGHRTRIALGHASSMGCHLRFGFEATYARDTGLMRNDNVADYAWLCFAVATAMQEYARLREGGVEEPQRRSAAEALLNGLSGDAIAFVGETPSHLSAQAAERAEFRDRFERHRAELLREFEAYRPSEQAYSPIAFFFNFSHNVLKGTVVDALLWGEPWTLTFNDLLAGSARGDARGEAKTKLANTLMSYARAAPDRIRGRLMPVIVYDPGAGHQAFALAMRTLKEA